MYEEIYQPGSKETFFQNSFLYFIYFTYLLPKYFFTLLAKTSNY